jgi:predicted ATPase
MTETQAPYIDWVRIKGYGCIQDVALRLTPLHALIGPNDSGKSTILRALQERVGPVGRGFLRVPMEVALTRSDRPGEASVYGPIAPMGSGAGLGFASGRDLHFQGSRFLRLDPDSMRTATPPIVSAAALEFYDERGLGLASVIGAILERDRERFIAIEAELKTLFPSLHAIQPLTDAEKNKILYFRMTNGASIEPEKASEGLLYALAFLVLKAMDRVSLLLIDEPENGLHPARIAEVVKVLRKLSETTQVLLATHSPLVINELEATEVSVITRSADSGTCAHLLAETPNFAERSEVYNNGDLWVSYSNGLDEKPLLEGGPRP